MAPRKDMMRIIRQDAGFSAKLGFGTSEAIQAAQHAGSEDGGNKRLTEGANSSARESVEDGERRDPPAAVAHDRLLEIPEGEELRPTQDVQAVADRTAPRPATRGQVVYVSVSLTARQATLAERWAGAAHCTVPFLIRHVAQALRDRVCDDWESDGMPIVDEPRGTRGKFPTSVTLTLRAQFAADLAARHDPLGIIGLGRAMGPAFRARFQAAFDDALANARIQMVNEGDEK